MVQEITLNIQKGSFKNKQNLLVAHQKVAWICSIFKIKSSLKIETSKNIKSRIINCRLRSSNSQVILQTWIEHYHQMRNDETSHQESFTLQLDKQNRKR